ncbi:hypothetical protein GCM10009792_24650 [Microcella alkalica]|uniref:DUF3105 domain-containing protein n=1 Tax=Microcella alkalica TaxID=355930 RepID=A0A839EAA9_9MICO|nr:hypothetical protein [Microcella alkalica]
MSNDENLTIKQQREKRRAEKVAALRAKQEREKRRNLIAIGSAVVGALAVIAIIVSIVVTSAQPRVEPEDIDIAGLETFDEIEGVHVEGAVDYDQTPPVGGPHNAAWLNCGIYEQEVPAENAVHSLEHGAVWVTYDPEEVTGGDLDALRDAMPNTYVILSPFEGLETPVVASAWGYQVQLDGVDDERLADFIVKYRASPDAPEPGALCTQAVDGPGKIA